MARTIHRPKLAVWKFSSCDGCQLQLLDLEDELLGLAAAVDIAFFLEATRATARGPFDLSLVEGSITTRHDAERIRKVRRQSRVLVAIGACANSGGIQALKNIADHHAFIKYVYPRPEYVDTLATSTGIADHVPVDLELRGCPVDRHQLLEVVSAYLAGRRPNIAHTAVCTDCKRRGLPCVMVAGGQPCLGPVTHAGCGALCPGVGRGCYGCFGPKETPNTAALMKEYAALGRSGGAIRDGLRLFNANADPFREEAARHDETHQG